MFVVYHNPILISQIKTKRNNSNNVILFNQMREDFENIYRDVGGYDMSYDEFKELCRKTWEENYHYLCIGKGKNRDQGRYCICKKKQKYSKRKDS